ncbi:MAG: hypothetical protein ACI924_000139 [Flavobacterium sp.]|jgi:hypothetical protein
MKNFIVLFLVFSFYSCSIPYDLETRYIIETKLVDSNGNAIANEEISVYVTAESSGETISKSISDENGTIRMIFPKPDVEAYSFSFKNENNSVNGYLNKNIFNIKPENFVDYKLVLNEIKLAKYEEITNFNIELDQVTQNKELRKIEIIGQVYSQNENLNPDSNLENYYDLQTYFSLFKNQNFTLKYSVFDYTTMLLEENNVNLSISDQPINYILTY